MSKKRSFKNEGTRYWGIMMDNKMEWWHSFSSFKEVFIEIEKNLFENNYSESVSKVYASNKSRFINNEINHVKWI